MGITPNYSSVLPGQCYPAVGVIILPVIFAKSEMDIVAKSGISFLYNPILYFIVMSVCRGNTYNILPFNLKSQSLFPKYLIIIFLFGVASIL